MGMALHVSDPDRHIEPDAGRNPTDVSEWLDDALPRLFGYFVVRVGGRVDIAEDLTQETVLAAVRAESRPAEDVPLMAWLYGIARHKLVDHYRREERERRHFGQPLDPGLIDIGLSPPLGELDLDSIHVRDDVITTLDRLPPRQRSALILRYFDGCDVPTTAALLDVTVHAAESLLARGRAAFRRNYREITGETS